MAANRPRKKTCSRGGCKDEPKKIGKRLKHYQEDYMCGVRVGIAVDLGDNPGRIAFQAERDLIERFHAMVPERERSVFLRRALHAELYKLADEKARAQGRLRAKH